MTTEIGTGQGGVKTNITQFLFIFTVEFIRKHILQDDKKWYTGHNSSKADLTFQKTIRKIKEATPRSNTVKIMMKSEMCIQKMECKDISHILEHM